MACLSLTNLHTIGLVSGGAFLWKDDRRRVLFFTEGWSHGVVNRGMVTRGGQQRNGQQRGGGHMGWSIEGLSQGVVNRGMVNRGVVVTWGGQ